MGCGCNQQTTTTTCNDCCKNTDPCVTQPCGCEAELDAACVRYTGEAIPCADISTGDTIETAFIAIGEKFCNFSGSYVTVINEPAGDNCENGGVIISVFDSESDALTGSTYICVPSTNYITVVEEVAGVNCSEGGVAVNTYDADDVLIDTIYICTPVCECPAVVPKENFYVEAISTVDVVADPSFVDLTYFQPVGYTTLTYTNTSGAAKDYIVSVSYDSTTLPLSVNSPSFGNWLDGALIKTVSAVDTVQYESLSTTILSVFLFDGATAGDTVVIGSTPPDQVLTTAGNPVEVRFLNGSIPKNTSFFKKVTLNNNETIGLKFRSKAGEEGWVLKAQMFVNEID